ncbi:MAG: beta-1,6-N-acetylglucosaminyltransferase [Tepidisphaeraceae bacterium]
MQAVQTSNSPAPTPPRVAAPVPARAAKVVYFVASHVFPEQVARLVRALRTGNPESRVVVHHDEKVSHLDPATVEPFDNVDLLPAMPVQWGKFITSRMLLGAVEWVCTNHDFDYVIYLSGQDYPIKPLAQIERELGAQIGRCDAFTDVVPARNSQWHLGPERYLYRYYDLPRFPGLMRWRKRQQRRSNKVRALAERTGTNPDPLPRLHVARDRYGERKVGVHMPAGLFGPRGLTVYAGSAWWTMSKRAAEHVTSFFRTNPAVARHYQRVLFAPGESMLPTILLNAPHLTCESTDHKRFVRWSDPRSGHPDLLTAADFPTLVASPHHFARKIDGRTDPRLLDLLDTHIRHDQT